MAVRPTAPNAPAAPAGPTLAWATAQLEVAVVRAPDAGAGAAPRANPRRALEDALAIEDERRRAEALVALLPRLAQADRERAVAPIVQAAAALQARGADAENVAGLGPESREGRLRAIEDYDAALALFRAVSNQEGEIRALASLGAAYSALNEHEMATGYYEDVLKLHRVRGDRTAIAITLSNLAAMYERLGQWESALDYYTEALPLWQEAGDRGGEAAVLNGMGSIYVAVDGARRALEYYEQALPLLREADNRTGEAITLDNIGGVYANMGEPRRAVEYFEQALKLRQQVGDPSGETATLGNLGAAYATLGEQQRARDCFERALKAAEAIEGDQARAEALVALVPHLSGRQRERAVALGLAAAERIRDPDRRAEALAAFQSDLRGAAEQDRGAEKRTQAPSAPLEFDWITIPAGEFVLGSDKGHDTLAYDSELPQQRIFLPEYRVARTLITNEAYSVFVRATGHRPPEHWEMGQIPAGKEIHPVVGVTWHDARTYCRWAGEAAGIPVRLPTEAEWEKAARGTDGRTWPWGEEPPERDRCNFADNVGDTTPVGAYPRGASPYGLLDMAGNVWEWTASLFRPYPYDANDGREDDTAEGLRTIRGGAYGYVVSALRCAHRNWNHPANTGLNVGFRVVSSRA